MASSSREEYDNDDDGSPKTTYEYMVDKDDPFEKEFSGSDVVLIVEGKKLHAHKNLLSLYCQYFQVLFNSRGFAETGTNELELKGGEHLEMKLDIMVTFLKQLYPVDSSTPITDDKTLEVLFPLADYFQCQHVRKKCETYIGKQLGRPELELGTSSLLFYLRLCSQLRANQFIKRLLENLSSNQLRGMADDRLFNLLTPEMQRDVLRARVKQMESCVRKFFRDYCDPDDEIARKCRVCRDNFAEAYNSCSRCFFNFVGDLGFPEYVARFYGDDDE